MREASPRQGATADDLRAAAAVAPRPLYVSGLVGSLWCIGIGLAVVTTLTLVGWIAAPRAAIGSGLPGVFRTAVNLWLVAHHAGFSAPQGRVGLLPLGLIVLPGAPLYRSGGWMIRAAGTPGHPGGVRKGSTGVVRVAAALAVPYSLLAVLLALAASSDTVRPSAWQALVAAFVVAFVAGALGAARALVAARRGRVRSGLGALLRLLPARPRSLVIGVSGAIAVLLASGAVLVGASLALHLSEAAEIYDLLAPGIVGGILLLLLELAFLPNAVIWGMAYTIGPGFAVGAGTGVSTSGVFFDVVPMFPALAALPEPGPAPLVSLPALAAPFIAGAVGGVLTIRAMPSPVYEGAPLWGFLTGALTGLVAAVLSALAGGPLGDGRMATVGPSAWQVGLLAALEVGISAAIAAWLANWRILRALENAPEGARQGRPGRTEGTRRGRVRRRQEPPPPVVPAPPSPSASSSRSPRPAPERSAPVRKPSPHVPSPLEFEEAEPVLGPRKPARAKARRRPRSPEPPPEPPAAPAEEEEVLVDGPTAAHPEREAAPPGRAVPAPRGDAEDEERTETRGGAIYVLKNEPDDRPHGHDG
ncbi:DUF6350 family protein [Actinomadura sp. NBRC 104412]|uniref:cell division protein PerM n=1 Tax=Actinomadura sp. NBRC 104412 TaxID=3032203 RepID=UPI0025559755|nr:DUF6350 family protein [Actinomadura sp. NBRC 104412]